ncbi:MAG: hypothetical protein L0Z55_00315 [Planctomycetes bacterium]|nr:hypothetical protein [Planctomycetota bacterium]
MRSDPRVFAIHKVFFEVAPGRDVDAVIDVVPQALDQVMPYFGQIEVATFDDLFQHLDRFGAIDPS